MNKNNLMSRSVDFGKIRKLGIERAILGGLSIVLLICQLMYYEIELNDSTLWVMGVSSCCFLIPYLSILFKVSEENYLFINSLCLNLVGFYSFARLLGWLLFNQPMDEYIWYFFLCSGAYLYHLDGVFKNISDNNKILPLVIFEIFATTFAIAYRLFND